MDESRKAFDSWFKNYTGCPHDQLGIEHISDLYFMVWAASRAAIEIELPRVIEPHPFGPSSAKMICAFHKNVVKECAESVRAAGIKVKE